MPHTWKPSTGAGALTGKLESFFFYFDFEVKPNNRRVTVNDGYFAVYLSQQSGPPAASKPDGAARAFDIQDEDRNVIKVQNADLIVSRLVEYSNEFNRLHVYKFDNGVQKNTWINTSQFAPTFVNPTSNQNRRPFWNHTLNFDSIQSRYIHWLLAKENAKGTQTAAMVTPLLAPSLLGSILAKDGQVMPGLSIAVQSRPAWTYFPAGSRDLPGNVRGYVMIAQGAFKAISLGRDIETWHIAPNTLSPEEVAERLTEVVHRASSLRRTIEIADETMHDSVIPSSPDGPIELLYLDNLNDRNEVPSLIG
jgi:hypothetical protein